MAIAFDAGSTDFIASASSRTFAHTCTGSNRGLFVGVEGDGGDLLTGATYAGVAMTLIDKRQRTAGRFEYMFYLAAPATGANNVALTAGGAIQMRSVAASYTGVAQTGQPEATNWGIADSVTAQALAVTTLTDNAWVIGLFESGQLISAGSGTTLRQAAATAVLALVDSGGPVTPAGSKTLNVNLSTTTNSVGIVAVIAPAPAGDTTPPTLTSPSGTGGTLACSGSVSTNEGNGTLYAVATASSTAPTAAQVKLGQDHTGAAALRVVSQAVTATGTQTVASGSVTAGTRYLHFMHEDAAANQSAVVSSSSFTVIAGASGTVTSSPLKDNTGTLHLSAPFEAFVLDATTGALVVRKTGLTSHASTGVVTFSDAAVTAATIYRVVWRQTTTGAQGVEVLTAT